MNTIQSQIQTQYNQVPFKSLKKIEISGYFDPSKHLKDAKIYRAFKKSEPIKEFFEKYDGIVEFRKGKKWLWEYEYDISEYDKRKKWFAQHGIDIDEYIYGY